ncbi:MAG: Retron-type reverse transcriptase [Xanthobacteraceae bacterium]|nr:MAG: Retron-type reverse transcriptase [Xanthobacteraceae bacterium]
MTLPRASMFGGSWINDGNAGSRYANVAYNWPDNSNDNIGARGRGDDCLLIWSEVVRTTFVNASLRARWRSRSRRSITRLMRSVSHDQGQWSARRSCFGKYTSRSGRAGRRRRGVHARLSRPAAGFSARIPMTKRYRNLIQKITAPSTMQMAYRLTARGKRLTPGYLAFKEFDALNLAAIAADMAGGDYRPGVPNEFYVFDPKRRLISALPFRDRVAQQALCLVIAPIFDRALLPRSFACRPGKGTHAGVKLLQSDLRRLCQSDASRMEPALGLAEGKTRVLDDASRRARRLYFLKTDFSRYFASIERPVLWRLIEAKISCAATLRLIEAMVPRAGIGLPIGSLTSQIFANLYTGATLDRHLQQTLGEDYWYRYMDDLVVLGESSEHLRRVKASIEEFSRARLGLRFSKWQIAPVSRGINFLGYRIWPDHKLLRRDSVVRARRKIAAYRAAGDDERLTKFCAAWLGHARFADSRNLIRSLGLTEAAE